MSGVKAPLRPVAPAMRAEAGELRDFLAAHPGIEAFDLLLVDSNGILRGKTVRRHEMEGIYENGRNLPGSILGLDVAGEDPMDAARREFAEEADLTAEGWEPLVSTYTTPGSNSEIIHIYLATGLSPAAESFARTDEEADIRLAWVPLDEAADGVLAGRLRNGILAVGVLAAERRLRGA